MSAAHDQLLQVVKDIVAPLIHADGGEIFVVSVEQDSIALHLAGRCAGCPGVTLTSATIIEASIHASFPSVRVTVTSGFQVPDGAEALPGALSSR